MGHAAGGGGRGPSGVCGGKGADGNVVKGFFQRKTNQQTQARAWASFNDCVKWRPSQMLGHLVPHHLAAT